MLVVVYGVYTYIYVRSALSQYQYWGLTFTFLAFFCLFIGAGKQVVYQKQVNQNKIEFKNKKLKTNLWVLGIFSYAQAIPFVLVSNFFYFVDIRKLLHMLPEKFRDKNNWLSLKNESVRDDVDLTLKILYFRTDSNKHDWRVAFMFYANVIPAACLMIDMLFNKIKIRFQHIKFNVIFTALYLFVAMCFELKTNYPAYEDNLNFFCKHNLSYIYDKSTKAINQTIELTTCASWEKKDSNSDSGFGCKELSQTYFCNVKGDDVNSLIDDGMSPYSFWKNCGLMITLMFVLGALIFLISYLFHRCKLCGARPYNPGKYQQTQKKAKDQDQKPEISENKSSQLVEGLIPKQQSDP